MTPGKANIQTACEAAVMLQNRRYTYGKHFARTTSKTETGTGKTITQQAEKLGLKFTPTPMLGVNDGINKALMMLPRLYISEPKCEQFLSAIRNYRKRWEEAGLAAGAVTRTGVSHFADMLRYVALTEDLMTNEDEQTHAGS